MTWDFCHTIRQLPWTHATESPVWYKKTCLHKSAIEALFGTVGISIMCHLSYVSVENIVQINY